MNAYQGVCVCVCGEGVSVLTPPVLLFAPVQHWLPGSDGALLSQHCPQRRELGRVVQLRAAAAWHPGVGGGLVKGLDRREVFCDQLGGVSRGSRSSLRLAAGYFFQSAAPASGSAART